MNKNMLGSKEYYSGLLSIFDQKRNSENAGPMAKYMKDLFPFFGIKSPQRNELLRAHIKDFGLPEDWKQVVQLCWKQDEREMQLIGMELAFRSKKIYMKEDIAFFEYMITTKSWWDTVDFIASNIIGQYFLAFPDQIKSVTDNWNHSSNMWLNRTCLLFQLKYKTSTDFKLLQEFIHVHKESNEFFLRKAIGWSLRQYAKFRPEEVRMFVNETELKPLSRKEALKHFS